MSARRRQIILATSFVIILLLLTKSVNAVTWNDCPYDKVNDEYPGDCARYIDTDNDGICDHSQPSPEERLASTETTNINSGQSVSNERDTITAESDEQTKSQE